ncbi:MAG TPA: PRC-barrel domain-containing protein [Flavisolibacter sp.]|nr:PRC-barrel domain-containing protein [Flavisolibacter sp.]
MDKMKHRRLQELDHSDFEIVKGEPDIRGWDVRNQSGQKIGEVEELVVDAQQKKVRYMVVDLDDNELKLQHRKVLLPIGLAELHQKDDDVILPNITAEHLGALPPYDNDHLTPDVERNICTTLGRKTETAAVLEGEELHSEFYRHEYYNDDNLYKHRLSELEQQKQQQKQKEASDYESGLRLWELRSDGGLLPESNGQRRERRAEINEDARMELVRNRRKTYEDLRRQGAGRNDDTPTHNRHRSIIDRTREEGLQDG